MSEMEREREREREEIERKELLEWMKEFVEKEQKSEYIFFLSFILFEIPKIFPLFMINWFPLSPALCYAGQTDGK